MAASPEIFLTPNGRTKANPEYEEWLEAPPDKFRKISGVMKLNPDYKIWRDTYQEYEPEDEEDEAPATSILVPLNLNNQIDSTVSFLSMADPGTNFDDEDNNLPSNICFLQKPAASDTNDQRSRQSKSNDHPTIVTTLLEPEIAAETTPAPVVSATSSPLKMHSLIQEVISITDKALLKPTMGNYVKDCSGIVILTAREYALGLSGQYGKGVLLQHFKKTNSWSLPVAIQMRGAGIGIQIGAHTKAMVIFLGEHQLKTFANDAIMRMGSQIGLTIVEGLEGDAYLDVSEWFQIDGTSAWTDTKGWRFCVSLQGNVISPMWKLNKEMYGDLYHPHSATNVTQKILSGEIKTKVSSNNDQTIKQLHQSLNTTSEKKFIPKWYVDENKEQKSANVA